METSSISTELLSTTATTNQSQCSAFDEGIYQAAGFVSLASGIISFMAACFIPFFVILFKQWSFFNQRLILYLSLAAIIDVTAFTLSRFDGGGYCAFGGFFAQVGSWMALNAYICITATLLLKAFFQINLEKLDIPAVLFIFLSPFLFNWIPFINNSYGKAGPIFCWIRSSELVNGTCEHLLFGEVLQLVLWYIPLYLTLSLVIIIYIIILLKFCKERRKRAAFDREDENKSSQAMNYTLSLLAYPVVYFLVNIFLCINRIYGVVKPSDPSPALWFLSLMFFPQQGTGCAIVFLFSIRQQLKLAQIKAALYAWGHKTQIREYPANDDTSEASYNKLLL